jgi:hypothetical protein
MDAREERPREKDGEACASEEGHGHLYYLVDDRASSVFDFM